MIAIGGDATAGEPGRTPPLCGAGASGAEAFSPCDASPPEVKRVAALLTERRVGALEAESSAALALKTMLDALYMLTSTPPQGSATACE